MHLTKTKKFETHTQLKEEIKRATQIAKDLYPTFNNDPTRIATISKPTTTKEITSTEQKENNKHW